MIKRVFRLFWSYDIEKTEEWLGDMAAEGYILQKVNTITRQFSFKKGKPQQFVYRIIFEKTSGQILPDTLIIRISRSILYYLRVKSNLQ